MRSSAKVTQPPVITDSMGDSSTSVIVCFHMTVAGPGTLMSVIVFLEAACKAAELGETGPDHGLESQVGELCRLRSYLLAPSALHPFWLRVHGGRAGSLPFRLW